MTTARTDLALARTLIVGDSTRRALTFAALALLGTAILTISAKIQVPFYPVPQTLQTLAVIGLAAAYGRNLAVATILLYFAQGFAGLPVFAGPAAGPAYFVGPTAGFLVGFVISAAIVGEAADRGWGVQPLKMAAAMLVGTIAVFALGFVWLSTFVGPEKAYALGVAPYIIGDLVKIALASALVAALWKLVRRA